ncbi:MAG: LysR substrate-binding domain-containing protein, partial [Acetobacteraceae bacterium]
AGEPRVPAYAGGRLPLSTHLAARVRALLQDRAAWSSLPEPVREWLGVQRAVSRLPGRDDLLVETFPRGGRFYLVAYGFEGRNAHQTLGMLLTRRLERAGVGPLGFVATDYALGVWCAHRPHDIATLFDEDMLGEDLENWLAESAMMKRLFRTNAVIAGLIERQHPGLEKSRRQVTVHSDLLYDVLRRYQPGHVLLRAARADAAVGMVDLGRVAAMLRRVKGRVRHFALSRISPLAVPVLVEIGRERVLAGTAEDELLAEAETLAAEAMVAALPAGHALAGRESLALADLAAETFILYPRAVRPGLADAVLAACEAEGFHPVVGQTTPQLSSTVNFVAAGLGVSIVPACMAQMRPEGVRYLPLIGPQPSAMLGIAWRRGEPAEAVRNFVATARAGRGALAAPPP